MRAVRVVVLAPVVDDDGGFGEAADLLDVEQLVAQAGVEGLDVGGLPGRAGLAERRCGPAVATPVSERVRGQLGTVVAADVRGRAAPSGEALEHGDGLSASMRRATCIASASRVNSSTMFSSFNTRP